LIPGPGRPLEGGLRGTVGRRDRVECQPEVVGWIPRLLSLHPQDPARIDLNALSCDRLEDTTGAGKKTALTPHWLDLVEPREVVVHLLPLTIADSEVDLSCDRGWNRRCNRDDDRNGCRCGGSARLAGRGGSRSDRRGRRRGGSGSGAGDLRLCGGENRLGLVGPGHVDRGAEENQGQESGESLHSGPVPAPPVRDGECEKDAAEPHPADERQARQPVPHPGTSVIDVVPDVVEHGGDVHPPPRTAVLRVDDVGDEGQEDGHRAREEQVLGPPLPPSLVRDEEQSEDQEPGDGRDESGRVLVAAQQLHDRESCEVRRRQEAAGPECSTDVTTGHVDAVVSPRQRSEGLTRRDLVVQIGEAREDGDDLLVAIEDEARAHRGEAPGDGETEHREQHCPLCHVQPVRRIAGMQHRLTDARQCDERSNDAAQETRYEGEHSGDDESEEHERQEDARDHRQKPDDPNDKAPEDSEEVPNFLPHDIWTSLVLLDDALGVQFVVHGLEQVGCPSQPGPLVVVDGGSRSRRGRVCRLGRRVVDRRGSRRRGGRHGGNHGRCHRSGGSRGRDTVADDHHLLGDGRNGDRGCGCSHVAAEDVGEVRHCGGLFLLGLDDLVTDRLARLSELRGHERLDDLIPNRLGVRIGITVRQHRVVEDLEDPLVVIGQLHAALHLSIHHGEHGRFALSESVEERLRLFLGDRHRSDHGGRLDDRCGSRSLDDRSRRRIRRGLHRCRWRLVRNLDRSRLDHRRRGATGGLDDRLTLLLFLDDLVGHLESVGRHLVLDLLLENLDRGLDGLSLGLLLLDDLLEDLGHGVHDQLSHRDDKKRVPAEMQDEEAQGPLEEGPEVAVQERSRAPGPADVEDVPDHGGQSAVEGAADTLEKHLVIFADLGGRSRAVCHDRISPFGGL
jgi:hypothetical protein